MPQQTKQTFPLEYRSLENTSKWPIKVPRKDEEEVVQNANPLIAFLSGDAIKTTFVLN